MLDVRMVSRGAHKVNELSLNDRLSGGQWDIMATHSGPRSYYRHKGHPQALTMKMDVDEHQQAAMDFMGGFHSAPRVQIQRRVGFIWLREPN